MGQRRNRADRRVGAGDARLVCLPLVAPQTAAGSQARFRAGGGVGVTHTRGQAGRRDPQRRSTAADRKELTTMTTSKTSAAAPPPVHPRGTDFLLRKPLTAPRAARIIASFTISATIIAGVLIHF